MTRVLEHQSTLRVDLRLEVVGPAHPLCSAHASYQALLALRKAINGELAGLRDNRFTSRLPCCVGPELPPVRPHRRLRRPSGLGGQSGRYAASPRRGGWRGCVSGRASRLCATRVAPRRRAWHLAKAKIPGSPGPATFNLGFLLQERGEVETAEAACVRADRMGDAAAAFNLGMLWLERADDESATAAFGRAAERGIAAGGVFLQVLSQPAGSARFREILSIACARDADHLRNVVNIGLLMETTGRHDAAASLGGR